jgi:hypothetical protein
VKAFVALPVGSRIGSRDYALDIGATPRLLNRLVELVAYFGARFPFAKESCAPPQAHDLFHNAMPVSVRIKHAILKMY